MEHKPQTPRRAGWLLLLTLALGYVCAFVFFQTGWNAPRDLMPAYALFWALYLAAYYLCLWQRAKARWEGWYGKAAASSRGLHRRHFQPKASVNSRERSRLLWTRSSSTSSGSVTSSAPRSCLRSFERLPKRAANQ